MATPLLPAMRWRRRRPSYSAVTSYMLPAGNRLCYSLVTKFAPGVPPGQTAFYSEPERSMIARLARWAMALALTEEHLALAESVRGWAGRAAPTETPRAAVADGDGGA